MSEPPPVGGDEPEPTEGAGRTPQIHQLRARYARRVTPEHLGQRVSVRHLLDDPDRGPIPSDVVGRLVGADAEALLIVLAALWFVGSRSQLDLVEMRD